MDDLEKIKYYLKIALINSFVLYSLLYFIELAINFKKDNLFKKTRLYYLNSLQDKTIIKYILIMVFISS